MKKIITNHIVIINSSKIILFIRKSYFIPVYYNVINVINVIQFSKTYYSKFLRTICKYFLFVVINILMRFPMCAVFSSLFHAHFIAEFFFGCRGGLNPSRLTVHVIYKKHERVFIPSDVYYCCLGQTFS